MDNNIKEGLLTLWQIRNWGEGRPDVGKPSKRRWKNGHDKSYTYVHGPDNAAVFYESYAEWKKDYKETQTALDFIGAFYREENPRWTINRYNALVTLLDRLTNSCFFCEEDEKEQEQVDEAVEWLYKKAEKYYNKKIKEME